MNCKISQNLMMELIGGDLTGRRKVKLERHLDHCPECRTEFESLTQTLETSRSIQEEFTPPEHLDHIIMTHAREHAAHVPVKPFFLMRPLPAMFALASVILVFSTVYLNRMGSPLDLYAPAEKQIEVSSDKAPGAPMDLEESDDRFFAADKKAALGSKIIKEEAAGERKQREDDSGLTIHRYKPAAKGRAKTAGDGMEDGKSSNEPYKRQIEVGSSLPAPEPDRSQENIEPVILSDIADEDSEYRENEEMSGEGMLAEAMDIAPIVPDVRFSVPAGATLPEVIHRVDPVYPPSLKKLAVTGSVTVEAVVSETGETGTPDVIASDHEMFTAAVIDALGQWRFKPALLNGEPVAATMTLVVVFGV